MKRVLLILLTLTLFNCSEDDDNDLSDDPIVGTWQTYKNILHTPSYGSDRADFNRVENHTDQEPMTFKSNGEYFTESSSNAGVKMTWRKTSDNTYILRPYDEDPDLETELEATFLCDNNILELKTTVTVEIKEMHMDEPEVIHSDIYFYMKKLDYNENDCDINYVLD